MGAWLIWIVAGGIVALVVAIAARKRGYEGIGTTLHDAENEPQRGREEQLALLVRDRSRYARNYARDMQDKRLSEADRQHFRQQYEQAKTNGLTELLAISDDFYRGAATHGVIDLLLAGGEIAAAKRLFDTLEESLQDAIASSKPDEYACLYRQ